MNSTQILLHFRCISLTTPNGRRELLGKAEVQGLGGRPVQRPSTNVSTQGFYGSSNESVGDKKIGLSPYENPFSAGTQASSGSPTDGVGRQGIDSSFSESQFSTGTHGEENQPLLDTYHIEKPSFAQGTSIQTAYHGRPSNKFEFLG
jgi:hypothetical protein